MKILIACECSGNVRREFRNLGHDAWSCDLQPADDNDKHHMMLDVREVLLPVWDFLIAFPPCTHLAASGAKHFARKGNLQEEALDFVRLLMNAPIKRIAIENPIGVISTRIRKPDQIIQPFDFGHPERKSTCLWLKNLPKLIPTGMLSAEGSWAHTKVRDQKKRSETFPGVAKAMAEQWGHNFYVTPIINPS